MSSNFETRERYELGVAQELLDRPSNAIRHLLDNGDGTYSIMGHIVCEHCDYCEESNEGIQIHKAKPYPYAEQSKKYLIDSAVTFFQVFEKHDLYNVILNNTKGLTQEDKRALEEYSYIMHCLHQIKPFPKLDKV